jgi:hypothetical protein
MEGEHPIRLDVFGFLHHGRSRVLIGGVACD